MFGRPCTGEPAFGQHNGPHPCGNVQLSQDLCLIEVRTVVQPCNFCDDHDANLTPCWRTCYMAE